MSRRAWLILPVAATLFLPREGRSECEETPPAILGILNIASGERPRADAINIDIRAFHQGSRPLIQYQADALALPFASGSFLEVVGVNLPSILPGMSGRALALEVTRVLAPGGKVRLTCASPAFRATDWEGLGLEIRAQGGILLATKVRVESPVAELVPVP